MDLLDRCNSSLFQAMLAQRMLLDVKGADPSPIVPILLVVVGSSAEFVILLMP